MASISTHQIAHWGQLLLLCTTALAATRLSSIGERLAEVFWPQQQHSHGRCCALLHSMWHAAFTTCQCSTAAASLVDAAAATTAFNAFGLVLAAAAAKTTGSPAALVHCTGDHQSPICYQQLLHRRRAEALAQKHRR
eukprot:1161116-Pelagomonas_calceolata.AAC.2